MDEQHLLLAMVMLRAHARRAAHFKASRHHRYRSVGQEGVLQEVVAIARARVAREDPRRNLRWIRP